MPVQLRSARQSRRAIPGAFGYCSIIRLSTSMDRSPRTNFSARGLCTLRFVEKGRYQCLQWLLAHPEIDVDAAYSIIRSTMPRRILRAARRRSLRRFATIAPTRCRCSSTRALINTGSSIGAPRWNGQQRAKGTLIACERSRSSAVRCAAPQRRRQGCASCRSARRVTQCSTVAVSASANTGRRTRQPVARLPLTWPRCRMRGMLRRRGDDGHMGRRPILFLSMPCVE